MKKYIALVLVAVLVLGIFTGCGNKGNKETESQTGDKATESVNSTENNTEDSTQSRQKTVRKIRMWLTQSSSPQKTDRRAQFLPVRQ